MARLPADEKNHFRLMKLLEYRETVAMAHVDRLLFRLYKQHLGRTTVPTIEEIYSVLSEANADFHKVTTLAEYIGQVESLLSASAQQPKMDFDMEIPQSLPENPTMKTLEHYVGKNGTDLEELVQRTQNRALQMTNDIVSSTERKLRDLVAENVLDGTFHRESREQKTWYAAKQLRPGNPQKALPTAETIIRTQSMQILNAAAVNGAQATSRLRDKLVGWRYCSNGDSRTRESHRRQNGVVAEKNHPFWDIWTPPNGYNCRCFLIPLYDPRKLESGKRPDMSLRPDPGFEFNPAKVYS